MATHRAITESLEPAAGTTPDRHRDLRPTTLPSPHALLAVQGWLASRLLLLAVALVVMYMRGWPLSKVFAQWDVLHFTHVAQSGYTQLTETAFFPGLPLVMALFSLIGIPMVATGVIVSLVGSGLAAWALYRLAGRGLPGAIASIAWCFAPTAVFGFVPYSEAPFCALAFWAWWFAKKDKWAIAAPLAAAACLFRITGLFLFGALVLVALIGIGNSTWLARLRRLAWLCLPIIVLGAYDLYLKVLFGSWTVWFEAEKQGWNRGFHWPWQGWAYTWFAAQPNGPVPHEAAVFRWELLAVAIGVMTCIWLFARAKFPEGSYVLIQVGALTCQVWFLSVARAMLVWFPVFTTAGGLARLNKPGWRRVTMGCCLAVGFLIEASFMVWWALRFYVGQWAG